MAVELGFIRRLCGNGRILFSRISTLASDASGMASITAAQPGALLLSLIFALSFTTAACQSQDQTLSVTAMAQAEVRTLDSLSGGCNPRLLVKSDSDALRSHVRRLVQNGEPDRIAAVFLSDPKWKSCIWYRDAAYAFVLALRNERKIQRARSSDAAILEALIVLTNNPDREIRANAAAAIRFDRPDIANRILLQEYASFIVPQTNVLDDLPLFCGPLLQEMGEPVPTEFGDFSESANLIPLIRNDNGPIDQFDPLFIAAVNEANQDLRKWYISGDKAGANSDLYGMISRAEFLSQIVKAEKAKQK